MEVEFTPVAIALGAADADPDVVTIALDDRNGTGSLGLFPSYRRAVHVRATAPQLRAIAEAVIELAAALDAHAAASLAEASYGNMRVPGGAS